MSLLYSSFFYDSDIARYLDRRFRFCVDEFKYTDVEMILSEVEFSRFMLGLSYVVYDFVKSSNARNDNYRLIFFESANNSIQVLHFIFGSFIRNPF